MKNILLVGNWNSDTGYAWWLMETFWLAIADHYRGSTKSIVCYPQVTEIPPRLAAANIAIVEATLHWRQPLTAFKLIKNANIGTIYFTDRSYIDPLYFLLRLAGAQHIILHDHAPGARSTPGPLKRALKRFVSSLPLITPDAYIAVSQQIYDRFLKVACLPEKKCHLARNGIDTEKFLTAVAPGIRSELQIAGTALLIVSSGRLTAYKGIQTIIEAAHILINNKKCSDIYFVHAGDGPQREMFEKLIAEYDLCEKFLLLGKRNDIPGVLKDTDIAVHASLGEGLSLSILEFMCSGLPVVVSDEPSVCQSVENGITGLHFSTGSASDLATKVEQLIRSREMRQQLGNNARQEICAHYALTDTIKIVINVVDRVINKTTIAPAR